MTVEELVVKHIAWLRKKSLKYYPDSIDADDLVSETIYNCLRYAEFFDRSKNFKPWAITIMENIYKTQYNRRKCILFTGCPDFDIYIGVENADQKASVSRLLALIRECNRKSCCIESVMLYAQGYTYEEIANKVGITIGTVKSRIYAGRKLLAQYLEYNCQ